MENVQKGKCAAHAEQTIKSIQIDEFEDPASDNLMEIEQTLQLGTGGRIWESVTPINLTKIGNDPCKIHPKKQRKIIKEKRR